MVELGLPDEERESRRKAKLLNAARGDVARANLLWVRAIPTLLNIRELVAEAERRDDREKNWIVLCEQIKEYKYSGRTTWNGEPWR